MKLLLFTLAILSIAQSRLMPPGWNLGKDDPTDLGAGAGAKVDTTTFCKKVEGVSGITRDMFSGYMWTGNHMDEDTRQGMLYYTFYPAKNNVTAAPMVMWL